MSDNLDLNRYLTAEPKYEIENNKYSTYAQSCYDKMMESNMKMKLKKLVKILDIHLKKTYHKLKQKYQAIRVCYQVSHTYQIYIENIKKKTVICLNN